MSFFGLRKDLLASIILIPPPVLKFVCGIIDDRQIYQRYKLMFSLIFLCDTIFKLIDILIVNE